VFFTYAITLFTYQTDYYLNKTINTFIHHEGTRHQTKTTQRTEKTDTEEITETKKEVNLIT